MKILLYFLYYAVPNNYRFNSKIGEKNIYKFKFFHYFTNELRINLIIKLFGKEMCLHPVYFNNVAIQALY